MSLIEVVQPEVQRDRWGRPVIAGVQYERPSSLAKSLEPSGGLPAWYGQRVLEGLRSDPTLLESSEPLKVVAEQAALLGGSKAGAAAGTAIHEAVEGLLRHGMLPLDCSPETEADALAVVDLIDDHFEPLLAEVFVVNDAVRAAGTADLLLRSRTTGGVYIGDIKSASSAAATAAKFSGMAWAAQMAVYARGRILTEDGLVDFSDVIGSDPSLDRGVVLHVQRGSGKAALVDVDLIAGWEQARLATQVVAARRSTPARVV